MIPRQLSDLPVSINFPGEDSTVVYGEGIYIGYRGLDKAERDVSFPFGHGLSYTSFELDELGVDVGGSVEGCDLTVRVGVTVRNGGERAGAHVVQVYVADPVSSVSRPVRELKGFAKVELAAGASERVEIELDQRAFSFWSPMGGRWAVEAGEFVIEVGNSSRDLPLSATISVDAPRLAAPLSADSTLEEWLADPVAGEGADKEVRSQIGADMLPVVANMPMSALCYMGLGDFGPAKLADLAARYVD